MIFAYEILARAAFTCTPTAPLEHRLASHWAQDEAATARVTREQQDREKAITELTNGVATSTRHLETLQDGVCLEVAVGLLEAIGEEHRDLKVSQLDQAQKIKSFCFRGGLSGGRIKVTNCQGAFGEALDG
ncbi:hypothetical protein [Streptomyces zaomyceticus]|uniref:hypothetical protein n=1 Tax=Streptomyces zaomyceticus TaxID=68286 RepID=UPI0036A97BE5